MEMWHILRYFSRTLFFVIIPTLFQAESQELCFLSSGIAVQIRPKYSHRCASQIVQPENVYYTNVRIFWTVLNHSSQRKKTGLRSQYTEPSERQNNLIPKSIIKVVDNTEKSLSKRFYIPCFVFFNVNQ